MALVNKINLKEIVSEQMLTLRAAWLRWAIVLGVLGMSATLGLVVAKRDPLYAVIAALAPLGLYLFQQVLPRRHLVPVIILCTAAFVPLSLPTGTGSRLVFSLVLTTLFVGVWLIRSLTVEKRFHLLPTSVNRPLLGFMLVTLISLGWSNGFRDPLVVVWNSFPFVQAASALVMIMLPGAFLLVVNYISQVRWLKVLAAIMLVGGVLGLVKEFLWNGLPVNTRGMFAMWVISLSVALVFFHRCLPWAVRGLLVAVAAGWVYLGFGLRITWLAGWLPALIALGVLCFRHSRKVFIGLMVGAMIYGLMKKDYLDAVVAAETNESGNSRVAAWQMNWRVTSEHLLFGTGPGGYAVYYMTYFPTDAMATHNNYLDILSQLGIFGLGTLLWFFGALVWTGYKLCLRVKGRGDFVEGMANAAFAGTIACIVFTGFGDWLIPFAYTQTIAGFDYAVYNWLFMGTLLVLDRVTRNENESGVAHNA